MSKTKHKDLQPWLDYFDMLRKYVAKGFLQMIVKKHECFITAPGLHAMSKGDNPKTQLEDGSIVETVLHLRYYAAWLSGEGMEYNQQAFAVNVVESVAPYEPLYTIVVSRQRRLWRWHDKIEVIMYSSAKSMPI